MSSKDFFNADNKSALQSIEYAQQIAFAPLVFQTTQVLRNTGLLRIVEEAGDKGISIENAAKRTKIPVYGVEVLFEAALGIGILIHHDENFFLSKTGSFLLNDRMTIVNMNFVQDVCYEGMNKLEKSIRLGKPEGLKTFGKWKTVYEGLSTLPAQVQKSWFEFDHFYSDASFRAALPYVFKAGPRKILDIGGNTGKWAMACLTHSKTTQVGIVDLPEQLKVAKKNLVKRAFRDQVSFYGLNVLDKKSKLPRGYDVIWMSQFLDCFSEMEIVSILKKCHASLEKNGLVFIMEPFWDKQDFKTSAFCLQMTSLYFTNIANGNSKMYSSNKFKVLIEKSGFKIVQQVDNLGFCHSLLKLAKV